MDNHHSPHPCDIAGEEVRAINGGFLSVKSICSKYLCNNLYQAGSIQLNLSGGARNLIGGRFEVRTSTEEKDIE